MGYRVLGGESGQHVDPFGNAINLGDDPLSGCVLLHGATAYAGFDECKQQYSNYFYCDGGDDAGDLNSAAAYVRAQGLGVRATLVLEAGDYNTDAEVDFTDISVIMLGRIVVDAGYHGIGIKAGSGTPGSTLFRAVIELRIIRAANSNTVGDIGIQLINLISSEIKIFKADKFYWGLELLGQGDGFAWNTFILGYLRDNDNADLVFLDEDVGEDSGYVNKNTFLGGNMHSNATQNIYFKMGDVGGFNDNTFLSIDLGTTDGIGIVFETGGSNFFRSARAETATYLASFVTSANPPHDNIIELTAGPLNVNETIPDGRNWVYNLHSRPALYEPLRTPYKGVFIEDFVGKSLRDSDIWEETFVGTGSGSLLSGQGFGKYRQQTGATINSTCLLNFNGVTCVRAFQLPRFKVNADFVETTNMEVSIFLRLDDNNYIGFFYDENVGGASTWHARSVEGGVPTDVDTTIAPGLAQDLEVWIKSTSEIEFRINEELVATITTNIDAGFMEPYILLENTEGAVKRVDYDYVTLEYARQ